MQPNYEKEELSHKALLSRLYKNYDSQKTSSKTHLRTPLPQPTAIKEKILPDKQLIPRIALKKQLEISSGLQTNINTLPVTINKGKILLSPQGPTNPISLLNQSSILQPKDQSTLNLTTSFVGDSAKKEGFLNKMEHIKIVDDIVEKKQEDFKEKRSPSSSPRKRGTSKGIKEKKSIGGKGKYKGNKQKERKETQGYLTPIDFIHLIRTDPEMTDEFCYLNKRTHPYDFQIVDFNERNNEEYMTISARVLLFIKFLISLICLLNFFF